MKKAPSQTKGIGACSFSGNFHYPLNLAYDPSTRNVVHAKKQEKNKG